MEDPVTVDPKHYTVELENEKVRVVRIKYGPHEKSVMHWHPENLLISLTDVHGQFTFPDGTTEEVLVKAGEVIMQPAGEHLPENLSDQPFEVVLVEFKS